MRVGREDLQRFGRTVRPAPPPIEPALTPADEARVIAANNSDPDTAARRARALAILRRPAAPQGADAALIALPKALPIENDRDRTMARSRLAEIGRMESPPPEVLDICRRRRVSPGDSEAFANALHPPRHDGSQFAENWPAGGGW